MLIIGLQTCGGNSTGGGEEGRRDLDEEQKINDVVFSFVFLKIFLI
jgi:hypothetical protein